MVLVIPKTTEKAYGLSQKNVYVFDVPMTANKMEIAAAVAQEFGVTVKTVKTVVQNGKAIRFSRGKNRYPGTTKRTDSKKAYVTLAEGDKLALFDAPEEVKSEETKKAEKIAEKAAQKVAKTTAKSATPVVKKAGGAARKTGAK